MRNNLRTSSAGSAPRPVAVRRGALSMKMGAFVSVAAVLTLPFVLTASAQAVGSPATLSSTLTSTTTSQVLNLTTTVTLNPSGTFHWSFTLTNPFGNTVHIRSFTAAPFCDLSAATNVGQSPNPGGLWTDEIFAFSPQTDPTLENNKINWFLSAGGSQNQFLLPGQTIVFFFDLPSGADPTFRGKAGALDTFGFSGDTLGCPPPPPVQGGGGTPPPGIPVRQHGPFYLAEAYPATVQSYAAAGATGQSQAPGTSGISPDNCFLNGSTQTPVSAADAVPGILCLSKNVTQILNNPFAICDSTLNETFPRVQAVHLSKIIPGSFKCDAFGMPKVDLTTGAISPAQTLFQDANHLRTWWTLRYTQPGTKFILDVVVVCSGLGGVPTFHIDRYVWIVVADVRTFPVVVDLLHQDAVGTFEIPCILGEDVASNIRSMFANFSTAVGQGNQNNIFNDLIDLEAYIALNTLMMDVAVPEAIYPGPLVSGQPTYQPPGNQAVVDTVFGTGRPFGILDTTENPCACKLLADLEFMGQQLGISFGPHTFLNGAPV
jgi:hypothetical protein